MTSELPSPMALEGSFSFAFLPLKSLRLSAAVSPSWSPLILFFHGLLGGGLCRVQLSISFYSLSLEEAMDSRGVSCHPYSRAPGLQPESPSKLPLNIHSFPGAAPRIAHSSTHCG